MNGNVIGGTLKYVTGYTGFSSKVDEQEGNYLALKFETVPEDATVTVEMIGSVSGVGPVELDEDRNLVVRVVNPTTQQIKVKCEADDYRAVEKTYKLTGLTLETEE